MLEVVISTKKSSAVQQQIHDVTMAARDIPGRWVFGVTYRPSLEGDREGGSHASGSSEIFRILGGLLWPWGGLVCHPSGRGAGPAEGSNRAVFAVALDADMRPVTDLKKEELGLRRRRRGETSSTSSGRRAPGHRSDGRRQKPFSRRSPNCALA
jgi:hypothetical protein